MTKKLNPDAIMSELGRESSFFKDAAEGRRPGSTAKTAVKERPAAEPTQPAPSETTVRSVRPVRRKKSRHPFDFYDDQIDKLRVLAAEDRLSGGMGSMSKMVRDALDEYLAKQIGEERT